MNYHGIPLSELKTIARDHRPRIKNYYIKSKLELIQLLSMKELPEKFKIEKMKLPELREQAKKKLIPGSWKLHRCELIELLYPSSNQHDKNDDHTQKHNDP